MSLTFLFFIPVFLVCIFCVCDFVIILVEINVDGFTLEMCTKRLPCMGKITEQNNCPIVKDIGHF